MHPNDLKKAIVLTADSIDRLADIVQRRVAEGGKVSADLASKLRKETFILMHLAEKLQRV